MKQNNNIGPPHYADVGGNGRASFVTNSSSNPTQSTERKPMTKISLLALLFGMGSWIAITGLWLEMPLLIQKLPEGWRLASHLNIMIQCANLGPIIYWFARKKRLLNEISATHIQMFVGIFSCAMLIFFWNQTFVLFQHEHSLVLFVATFGLALVDCTSSVTFLPFMARFDSSYMTPYLVGEGLSGFIPSMVALLQGVGEDRQECAHSLSELSMNVTKHPNASSYVMDNTQLVGDNFKQNNFNKGNLIQPRFSVEIFFFSLFFTICVSYLSFCALQFLPECRAEMKRTQVMRRKSTQYEMKVYEQSIPLHDEAATQRMNAVMLDITTPVTPVEQHIYDDQVPVVAVSSGGSKNHSTSSVHHHHHHHHHTSSSSNQMMENELQEKRRTYYYLLGLMALNCFTTFGFMPSVQPYSALPYGVETLHYVVILSGLSYPGGCFFGMLVENKSVRAINFLTILGTCIGLYIVACALMSPTPFLVDHPLGGLSMIVAWISFVAVLSYVKTMITLVICDYFGSKGMFWVGMNTQFGAAAGALTIFFFINYTKLFNDCSKVLSVITNDY